MENLMIYAVSDSIGETAQQVSKAAVSQFGLSEDEYYIRRFPFVRTEEALIDLLNGAKEDNALFVYTLVDPKLAKMARDFCDENGLLKIDLMTDILNILIEKTGKQPLGEAGRIRKMDESYFRRIAAIEFAVKYDDGKDPGRGIKEAELVLIGISRTSKTPLSMYLANRNIKVANVPLVPEIPVPKEVYEIDPKKIIGLTNSPEVLNNVRTNRLKALGLSSSANYAKLDRILEELEYSEQIMKKIGCPVINVANKAIEETAGDILDIMKEKGIHKKIHKDH